MDARSGALAFVGASYGIGSSGVKRYSVRHEAAWHKGLSQQHDWIRSRCRNRSGGSSQSARLRRARGQGVCMSDNAGPPINLPSGVLLMASSILAIASVGSVFELTSGHPQYGTPVTAAILSASFPGFLFLFWATLQKGKAEESE